MSRRLLGREALQTIWKPLNERLPPVLNKVVTSLYHAGVIGLDDHDDIVLRGRDTRRDVASLLSSLSRQLLDRVLQFAVVLQSIEGVEDLGVVLQEEVHRRETSESSDSVGASHRPIQTANQDTPCASLRACPPASTVDTEQLVQDAERRGMRRARLDMASIIEETGSGVPVSWHENSFQLPENDPPETLVREFFRRFGELPQLRSQLRRKWPPLTKNRVAEVNVFGLVVASGDQYHRHTDQNPLSGPWESFRYPLGQSYNIDSLFAVDTSLYSVTRSGCNYSTKLRIDQYDTGSGRWLPDVVNLPDDYLYRSTAATVLDNRIAVIVGGCKQGTAVKKVLVWDARKSGTVANYIEDIPFGLGSCSLATAGMTSIYVGGGATKQDQSNNRIVLLDMRKANRWHDDIPAATKFESELAYVDGRLLSVGGKNSAEWLFGHHDSSSDQSMSNYVEMLVKGVWHPLPRMQVARVLMGKQVNKDGVLTVYGGLRNFEVVSSVETLVTDW